MVLINYDSLFVYKNSPERTGFNMYAENTQCFLLSFTQGRCQEFVQRGGGGGGLHIFFQGAGRRTRLLARGAQKANSFPPPLKTSRGGARKT